MSPEPNVAVVVPTWNSARFLLPLLDSIAAQGEAVELLVIDNGSDDGTVDMLRERGIPHVTLGENKGFAAAVDLGAERTAAPFVLPLNVDTVLEPGFVATLAAALAADPGLGGVAPRILQLEGEGRALATTDPDGAGRRRTVDAARLYSAGQGLTRDGRAAETGAGERQSSETLRRREVFGVCGAACLLRRELFTDLGGYERSFFAFYEDVDLNVRAQIAGWRFDYVPEAVVWHVGNASWLAEAPRPNAWNARLVARNRIVTQARFMPAASLPRILAVELGAVFRAAREGRLGATVRGKLEGLRLLPAALRERRRLAASGDLSRPRAWLGR